MRVLTMMSIVPLTALLVLSSGEALAGRCKYGTKKCRQDKRDHRGCCVLPPAPRGKRRTGKKHTPKSKGVSCPDGQVTIDGHCCWRGQDWDVANERCIGKPRKCPRDMVAEETGCACGGGQVLLAKVGRCCWPGQGYTRRKGCIGTPQCTGGYEPSKDRRGCKKAPVWIRIVGGSFQMGSNSGMTRDKPVHTVKVGTFMMSRTEVTVAQYRKCVNAGKCSSPKAGKRYNWDKSGRGSHPVNGVDWNQARSYCRWVGGRLPSEAEWEYAARSGGKAIKYPWGNEGPTCSRAVMDGEGGWGCGKKSTWPVCSKASGNTSQGLCDMAGNVWEWVEDCWHESYSGAPSHGSAWTVNCFASNRVDRGGSWRDTATAGYLRAAYRYYDPSGDHNLFLGLRCAR